MLQKRFRSLWLAGAIGAAAACSDAPGPTAGAPRSDDANASIADGANGGNVHFYFLPPLVKQPAYTGTFDATLAPIVEVCELAGTACGPLVARFTPTTGTGGEVVRVDAAAQHYAVNWHTNLSALDPAKTYRIRVLAKGGEAGHADVDVAASGSELKNIASGEFVGLLNGRTLPIKFRLEEGLVTSGSYTLVDRLIQGEPMLHAGRTDQVTLTAPAADGEVVQYLAERDTDGLPVRLLGWVKRAWGQPNAMDVVHTDAQGRPTRVVLRDGSQMALDYITDARVKLTVILADGNQSVTFVDVAPGSFGAVGTGASLSRTPLGALFSAGSAARPPVDTAARDAARARLEHAVAQTNVRAFRKGQAPIPAAAAPAAAPTRMAALAAVSAAAVDETRIVEVSVKVGENGDTRPLTGAAVSGAHTIITGEIGKETVNESIPFMASEQGGAGVYKAVITYAGQSTPQERLDRVCRANEAKIDVGCKIAGVLDKVACLAFLRVPAYGVRLAAACEAAMAALDYGCTGKDLCDLMSKAYNALSIPDGSLVIRAQAAGNDFREEAYRSFFLPAPSTLPVDILIAPLVSLRTFPEDPAPYQGYEARTSLYPALSGVLMMSYMYGTDGYAQSGAGYSNSAGEWGMFIPGAVPNVVDNISTYVLGQTRTTSIVF